MQRTKCLALAALLGLAAAPAIAASKAPAPASNATVVAIYIPPSELLARYYSTALHVWIEPGRALADAADQVGKGFFPNASRLDLDSPRPYGLLVDIDPKWEPKNGKVQLTLQFNVFKPGGAKVYVGSTASLVPVKGGNMTAAAYTAARQAMANVMSATLANVAPDAARFPAGTAGVDHALLVDHSKPTKTGTGFFINASGQLLTADHVQRDCVVLEARKDGQVFPVHRRAASDLLDVAVLDSGKPVSGALPLRMGEQLVLGESVTSVGYPLQGLLSESPNLTRGNISSANGIKGSYGTFQFSAPIQPGNSGGPVVSDNGELLGIAVGTLNAKMLVDKGLLPQNVNFALDSQYIARFLRRERVAFQEVQPKGPGEMKVANDAALGATVQLACYQ